MADRERTRVPYGRSDVLKGSLHQGPSAHPRNASAEIGLKKELGENKRCGY